MQKLSLTVLLKFLSKYSHWNLVRQSNGYNLHFIARESSEAKYKTKKRICSTNNRINSKAGYKTKNNIPTSSRSKSKKGDLEFRPLLRSKDECSDDLDNTSAVVSRRSSFSSFIWDDYLPSYQQESDEIFKDEDSGKSTPVVNVENDAIVESFHDVSVLRQGDKLLKEMLDLRKDLEKDKQVFEVSKCRSKVLPTGDNLLPDYGPLEKDEESVLRERLEMMTMQIKQEMEVEFKKTQSKMEFEENEDDDSKIKKIFENMLNDQQSALKSSKSANKEALQMAIKNLLLMNETPKTFEEAHKLFNTSPTTTSKKSRKKEPTKTKEPQTVEIPFCSHKIKTKVPGKSENDKSLPGGQSSKSATIASEETSTKLEMSWEEQKAANDILKELVEIRGKETQTSDPILDTMMRFQRL